MLNNCEKRRYHRIMLMDLKCVECGKQFTPEETMENERRKIAKMEASRE